MTIEQLIVEAKEFMKDESIKRIEFKDGKQRVVISREQDMISTNVCGFDVQPEGEDE